MKIENYMGWLFFFLAIIIVVALAYLSYQEEFTIYEEECKNETSTFSDGDNFICSDGSRGFLNGSNLDMIYKINSSCYVIRGEKQVCNKVEVEEIEYKEEVDSCQGLQINIEGLSKMCGESSECIKQEIERNKERRNVGEDYYCLAECSNIDKSCKWFKVFDISKKDITKEWLENHQNCECIKTTSEGATTTETVKGRVYVTKLKCIKYKCFENYFVEVN